MRISSGVGSLRPSKSKYLRGAKGPGLPNFHMRAVRPGGWAGGGLVKKPVTSSDKAALAAVRKPCK